MKPFLSIQRADDIYGLRLILAIGDAQIVIIGVHIGTSQAYLCILHLCLGLQWAKEDE